MMGDSEVTRRRLSWHDQVPMETCFVVVTEVVLPLVEASKNVVVKDFFGKLIREGFMMFLGKVKPGLGAVYDKVRALKEFKVIKDRLFEALRLMDQENVLTVNMFSSICMDDSTLTLITEIAVYTVYFELEMIATEHARSVLQSLKMLETSVPAPSQLSEMCCGAASIDVLFKNRVFFSDRMLEEYSKDRGVQNLILWPAFTAKHIMLQMYFSSLPAAKVQAQHEHLQQHQAWVRNMYFPHKRTVNDHDHHNDEDGETTGNENELKKLRRAGESS